MGKPQFYAGSARYVIRAIAFDFDGVLVESVDVKTRAFARLFAGERPEAVRRIVEYHLKNSGVSRFEKFKAIYRDILERPLTDAEFRRLCEEFAKLVVQEIVVAPWVEGAREFLIRHQGRYEFFIISGTPEEELQEIVRRRGMGQFFSEVLGAPRTKDVLLSDVLVRHEFEPVDVVFVGDAETDWAVARQIGVRFIWRRGSEDLPSLPGFSGPSIPSLAHLDRWLAALTH